MKVLYAIQGTGNGHLARASEIIPILKNKVETHILCSGLKQNSNIDFGIDYKVHGLGFTFGQKGGIDYISSYKELNSKQVLYDVKSIPVEDYDLVINDFEPITAWACRLRQTPCVSLSHQAALLSRNSPKPKKRDLFSESILRYYAPVDQHFGFHFSSYDDYIYTPIIRKSIRETSPTSNGHYAVYLPAYSDGILTQILSKIKGVEWHVFSKHAKSTFEYGSIKVVPLNNERFIQSLGSCNGVLCGAGFETPAEALYLNKKLMVVPMKGQYEQACNAAALAELGIPVLDELNHLSAENLQAWVDGTVNYSIEYPDQTEMIVEKALRAILSIPVK